MKLLAKLQNWLHCRRLILDAQERKPMATRNATERLKSRPVKQATEE